MSTVKYTKDHEWIAVDGDIATVGVTDYALKQLGDLVFVEVPDAGKQVAKGEEAAVVESVKAASELYSPVSGEVTEGNSTIAADPSIVSGDPSGDGWFFKIKMSEPGDLSEAMDEAAYKAHLDSLD